MTEGKGSKPELLRLVGDCLDQAEPAPDPDPSAAADDPEYAGDDDSGLGGDDVIGGPGRAQLPEKCPVVPLGIEGDLCFYLDEACQLRAMKARDHGKLPVANLFGRRSQLLWQYWPRFSKPRRNGKAEIIGWRNELAAEALMAAAADQGVWDPFKRVRGAGAWVGGDGELVLHLGDQVLVFAGDNAYATMREHRPGKVGEFVYPAFEAVPGPSVERASGGEDGPAMDLLRLLNTWSWRRGEVDARLLLGWIGAAILGGALDWRPLIWITGGKGTGKSTLHKVINHVFGGSIVTVSDASAAGIWQRVGYGTLPVALDEAEAREDNRAMERVLRLARQAASGGVVLRGGADHNSTEFVARSCFMFSSILVPPLEAPDRSRLAILELGELGDQPAPKIDGKRLKAIGEQLRRRLVDGWHRFPRTLALYRSALEREGMSARGADQFGNLLAAADLLLHDDDAVSDVVGEWALKVAPIAASDFDKADGGDEYMMVNHLTSSIIDPFSKGQRQTVGKWIREALRPGDDGADANQVLGTYGLKVVFEKPDEAYLAIANRHNGLSEIFRGTHWAGKASATNVWVQAARRLPGAVAIGATYFAGAISKAVRVPIGVVVPADVPADDVAGGAAVEDDGGEVSG